jgi:hypothetical protein
MPSAVHRANGFSISFRDLQLRAIPSPGNAPVQIDYKILSGTLKRAIEKPSRERQAKESRDQCARKHLTTRLNISEMTLKSPRNSSFTFVTKK